MRFRRDTVFLLALAAAFPALAQTRPTPARDDRPSATTDRDAPRTEEQAEPPPPPAPPAPRDARLPPDGGSVFQRQMADQRRRATLASASFFTVGRPEPRLFAEHDLITVIVREDSRAESEAEAETEKSAFLRAALTQFIRLRSDTIGLENAIGGEIPRIDLSGSGGWEGEGEFERSDRFQARITAEVVDVKPNGNLVLAARKHITHDREEQVFLLTGTCRADDVTADNSVLSTQLADLDLRKFTDGQIADAVKKGLLPRLYDKINPF